MEWCIDSLFNSEQVLQSLSEGSKDARKGTPSIIFRLRRRFEY